MNNGIDHSVTDRNIGEWLRTLPPEEPVTIVWDGKNYMITLEKRGYTSYAATIGVALQKAIIEMSSDIDIQ